MTIVRPCRGRISVASLTRGIGSLIPPAASGTPSTPLLVRAIHPRAGGPATPRRSAPPSRAAGRAPPAALELPEPRVDVPAQRLDREIRPRRENERAAPRARRADDRARRHGREAARRSAHEDVTRILAGRKGREHEAG